MNRSGFKKRAFQVVKIARGKRLEEQKESLPVWKKRGRRSNEKAQQDQITSGLKGT